MHALPRPFFCVKRTQGRLSWDNLRLLATCGTGATQISHVLVRTETLLYTTLAARRVNKHSPRVLTRRMPLHKVVTWRTYSCLKMLRTTTRMLSIGKRERSNCRYTAIVCRIAVLRCWRRASPVCAMPARRVCLPQWRI